MTITCFPPDPSPPTHRGVPGADSEGGRGPGEPSLPRQSHPGRGCLHREPLRGACHAGRGQHPHSDGLGGPDPSADGQPGPRREGGGADGDQAGVRGHSIPNQGLLEPASGVLIIRGISSSLLLKGSLSPLLSPDLLPPLLLPSLLPFPRSQGVR